MKHLTAFTENSEGARPSIETAPCIEREAGVSKQVYSTFENANPSRTRSERSVPLIHPLHTKFV